MNDKNSNFKNNKIDITKTLCPNCISGLCKNCAANIINISYNTINIENNITKEKADNGTTTLDNIYKQCNTCDYSSLNKHTSHCCNTIKFLLEKIDKLEKRIDTLESSTTTATKYTHKQALSITHTHTIYSILSLNNYNEDLILIGCSNGSINKYNINEFKLVEVYKGHTDYVYDMAYLGEVNSVYLCASCSGDQTIKIWDVANNNSPVITVNDIYGLFRIENILYDSKSFISLLSGNFNGEISLWQISFESSLSTLIHNYTYNKLVLSPKHDGYVRCLTYIGVIDNNIEYMLSGGDDDHTIYQWDVSNNKLIKNYSEHQHWIQSICYYKKDIFISSSLDRTIKLWSLYENQSIHTFQICNSYAISMVIIPEENILIASINGNDQTVRIYDLENKNNKESNTFSINTGSIYSKMIKIKKKEDKVYHFVSSCLDKWNSYTNEIICFNISKTN